MGAVERGRDQRRWAFLFFFPLLERWKERGNLGATAGEPDAAAGKKGAYRAADEVI